MKDVYLHLLIILATVLVFFLAGWFFAYLCLRNDKMYGKIKETNDSALDRAYHRFAVLYKSAILWTIAEYVFVIVPFVSNVIVIYLGNTNRESINMDLILFHSIVSLSFIVFGYAISPQRQKKCYRKAFRCLDNCINEYLLTRDVGNPDITILNKGIKKGEDFIDNSYDID